MTNKQQAIYEAIKATNPPPVTPCALDKLLVNAKERSDQQRQQQPPQDDNGNGNGNGKGGKERDLPPPGKKPEQDEPER